MLIDWHSREKMDPQTGEVTPLTTRQQTLLIQKQIYHHQGKTLPPLLVMQIQEHLPWMMPKTRGAPVVNYRTARLHLVNKPFLGSSTYREQQGRAVRKGCHPLILQFEKAFIAELKMQGIPAFAHTMYRDGDEQDRLYAEGRSNARAGESAHNHGMAGDIIHSVLPWNLSDDPDESTLLWDIMGWIGKEVAARQKIDVIWGGDWKTLWDPAHWELENWRSRLEDSELIEARRDRDPMRYACDQYGIDRN